MIGTESPSLLAPRREVSQSYFAAPHPVRAVRGALARLTRGRRPRGRLTPRPARA